VQKIKNANDLVYRALETGDMSKLDSSYMVANIVDHGMGPKDVVGIDSVKSYLAMAHTMFSNLKFTVLNENVDSVYSTILVKMTGTATSPASGFPVGTVVDMNSIDLVKWKDGKAAEHWSFMDMKDVYKMMPPPPPTVQIDTVKMH
jgi:predicted ester cyclase